MLAGPLRQDEDASDNERRDDRRRDRAAERQSAVADRLVEEIADRGAERPRQDESGPEQEDPRDAGEEIGRREQRQPGGKHKSAVFISGAVGHPVAERRSERLREG